MKLLGKNAIFSLRINIMIGEDVIIGVATGTALCLRALPLPSPLKIKKNMHILSEDLSENNFYLNLEKLS